MPCVVGLVGAAGLVGVLAGALGAAIREGLADGAEEGTGLTGDAVPDRTVH
jgi:hypothetical protein